MKTQVVLCRIKEGKLEKWKAWTTQLQSASRSQAVETLRDEKIIEELAIIFEIKREFYVLGFAEGEMLPADMSREINKKHKQMREECLEFINNGEVLYHLKLS